MDGVKTDLLDLVIPKKLFGKEIEDCVLVVSHVAQSLLQLLAVKIDDERR